MNMKLKQLSICLMIALFIISACNRPNPLEGENNAQGKGQTSSEVDRHGEQNKYEEIGLQATFNYLAGATNVIETKFNSLNILEETKRDDERLIEKVIYDIPEVTPSLINIIGERVWVYVLFERSLTLEEEEEKKSYIEDELFKANPRFEYEVKIYGATEWNGRHSNK